MVVNITHRELTNYERWQLEKFGNVLSEYIPIAGKKFEVDEEEQERFKEWINLQEELKLMEEAEFFGHTNTKYF